MVEKSDIGAGLELDFVTPVQFIAKLLLELRERYFLDEDRQDYKDIRSRINYALDRLNNKQTLFSVDPDLLKTPLIDSQAKDEEQPNVNSDIPPDEGHSQNNGEPIVQRVRTLT